LRGIAKVLRPALVLAQDKLVRNQTVGDFTFWLRLSLSLNFGLSTFLSQKVKWFRWAKTWRLTRIV